MSGHSTGLIRSRRESRLPFSSVTSNARLFASAVDLMLGQLSICSSKKRHSTKLTLFEIAHRILQSLPIDQKNGKRNRSHGISFGREHRVTDMMTSDGTHLLQLIVVLDCVREPVQQFLINPFEGDDFDLEIILLLGQCLSDCCTQTQVGFEVREGGG